MARKTPPYKSILPGAAKIVHGPRAKAYGHPIDGYDRAGRIWAGILGVDKITAEQVMMCMIGFKIARELNRSNPDNVVDIAGYADCIAWTIHERAARASRP